MDFNFIKQNAGAGRVPAPTRFYLSPPKGTVFVRHHCEAVLGATGMYKTRPYILLINGGFGSRNELGLIVAKFDHQRRSRLVGTEPDRQAESVELRIVGPHRDFLRFEFLASCHWHLSTSVVAHYLHLVLLTLVRR